MAKNQLIDFTRQLAQCWHSEEFEADKESESTKSRRYFFFTMPRNTAQILTLPPVLESFSAARAD